MTNEPDAITALLESGLARLEAREFEQAQAIFQQALQQANTGGNRSARVVAMIYLAAVHLGLFQPGAAIPLLEQARADAVALGLDDFLAGIDARRAGPALGGVGL